MRSKRSHESPRDRDCARPRSRFRSGREVPLLFYTVYSNTAAIDDATTAGAGDGGPSTGPVRAMAPLAAKFLDESGIVEQRTAAFHVVVFLGNQLAGGIQFFVKGADNTV